MGKHRRPRVTISLDEDVYWTFKVLADDLGEPASRVMERVLSSFVRDRFRKVARELVDHSRVMEEVREAYARLIGQVGRVGNNLNQIAWHLNAGGALDERVAVAVEGIERALVELVRAWHPSEVLRRVREEGDVNQG